MVRYSFEVDARDIAEACAKLSAFTEGTNCPCKLPPWGEESAKLGSDHCTCIVILIEQKEE